jgi:hypothetical protein
MASFLLTRRENPNKQINKHTDEGVTKNLETK